MRPPAHPPPRLRRLLRSVVDVREGEIAALLLGFAYFFCLLCSYYMLRPLRDAMGLVGGADALQWLFSLTFVVMLLLVPVFGALVRYLPPRRFVTVIYRFFAINILLFCLLITLGVKEVFVARLFFVWVSVYNLFVVSIFWSVLADRFSQPQGKRLFGFIAAGGTAGTFAGPALAAGLATTLGPAALTLAAALLLELSLLFCRRLMRHGSTPAAAGARSHALPSPPDFHDRHTLRAGRPAPQDGFSDPGHAHRDGVRSQPETDRSAGLRRDRHDTGLGGGILAGFTLIRRSPYLLGIVGYMLLHSSASTFLYFEQGRIVAESLVGTAERTRFFARVDLLVSVLTLLLQMLVTGRLLRRFGVAFALVLLPLAALLAFAGVAIWPGLLALALMQGLRRAVDFAFARPAREVLFTVLSREEKYKAKNFIETVVYRGGDAASGWISAGFTALGLGFAALGILMVPMSLAWAALALRLGRRQERIAAGQLTQGDKHASPTAT